MWSRITNNMTSKSRHVPSSKTSQNFPTSLSLSHYTRYTKQNNKKSLHTLPKRTIFQTIQPPEGIRPIIESTSRWDVLTSGIRFRIYLTNLYKNELQKTFLTPITTNYRGSLMRATVHNKSVLIHPSRNQLSHYHDRGSLQPPALWKNYLQVTLNKDKTGTFPLWLISNVLRRQQNRFITFLGWYFFFSGMSGLISEYNESRSPTLSQSIQETFLEVPYATCWSLINDSSRLSKKTFTSVPYNDWAYVQVLVSLGKYFERINYTKNSGKKYLDDTIKNYNNIINSLLFLYHNTNINEASRSLITTLLPKAPTTVSSFITSQYNLNSYFNPTTSIPTYSLPDLLELNPRGLQTILQTNSTHLNKDNYSFYLIQLGILLAFARRNYDALHSWALANGQTPLQSHEHIDDSIYKTLSPVTSVENLNILYNKLQQLQQATPLKDIDYYPSNDVQVALQNNINYPLLILPLLSESFNLRSVTSHLLPPQSAVPCSPLLPTTDQITAQNTLIPTQLLSRYTINGNYGARETANVLLLIDLCLLEVLGEYRRVQNTTTEQLQEHQHNLQQQQHLLTTPLSSTQNNQFVQTQQLQQPIIADGINNSSTATTNQFFSLYEPMPLPVSNDDNLSQNNDNKQ